MYKNLVLIIGSPNVGKSTLFNRLTRSHDAIVSNLEGTTINIKYGSVTWNKNKFQIADSGGISFLSKKNINKSINQHTFSIIKNCKLILLVLDIDMGFRYIDLSIIDKIKKNFNKKNILIVINKFDNNIKIDNLNNFYINQINHNDIFAVSAINGYGTGELLDRICTEINSDNHPNNYDDSKMPIFSLIGKPNVGKSSFLNTLMKYEYSVIDNDPGTTRDTIDITCNLFGYNFKLLDTAGIRKKSKVKKGNIEYYSNIRSINSISRSDVVILMIDSIMGITHQDIKIIKIAIENGKGILIASNKWDLIENENKNTANYIKSIRKHIMFYYYIPILCCSVTNKKNIIKIINIVHDIYMRKNKKIQTSDINKFLLPIITNNPPQSTNNKIVKIKYITQIHNKSVIFAIFGRNTNYIAKSYIKFLEKNIRNKYDFNGIPIKIITKDK
ncbi:MAG: ribosome biogenesis GTPase Der [Bacteroides sp.]|nr:MAG: ribosome biogenesis GTPase Der [Bacteroides sp.]